MIAKFRTLIFLAALILPLGLPVLAHAQAPAQAPAAQAQAPERPGGEANLVLPDLSTATFQGINGRTLLMGGLLCASSASRSAW